MAGSAEVVRRSEGASRGRGRIVCVLVGLVSAWLSGSTRPAVWLRRRIDPAMQNQPVLVYSVVLVAAALEALRRQVAREHPPPASP